MICYYICYADDRALLSPSLMGLRILSPFLLNIVTNPMIVKLNQIKSGYCLNGNTINNL